jgi:two-component system cell cycle sensor histidine kinase/response regulator CckA
MGKRVLFIEGDQTISDAVANMLEGAGHRAHLETSGADALKVFSRSPSAFDLIVMDVGLPDISGLRLAEKLLGLRADIPLVLLAGEEAQAQSRERNSGIRYFGAKPLSMTDLAETVERALRGGE